MDLRGLNVIENGLPCPSSFYFFYKLKFINTMLVLFGGECWKIQLQLVTAKTRDASLCSISPSFDNLICSVAVIRPLRRLLLGF